MSIFVSTYAQSLSRPVGANLSFSSLFKTTPILAVQTDRCCLLPGVTLAQAVGACIVGGASLIIFAEHDLPAGPRATVAGFVSDSIDHRVPMVAYGASLSRLAVDGQLLEPGADSTGVRGLCGCVITNMEDIDDHADFNFGVVYGDWNRSADTELFVRELVTKVRFPVLVGIDPPPETIKLLLDAGASGIILSASALNSEHPSGVCRNMITTLLQPTEITL